MGESLKDFKDEILHLKANGLGSIKISREIKNKYGFNAPASSIRRLIRENRGSEFKETVEEAGFKNPNNWSYGWLKTENASVFIRNTENVVSFDEMREDFIKEVSKHSPKFEKINRKKSKDPHLLVVDIADLHIGKLAVDSESGDAYNVKTAIKRGIEGIEGLIQKSNGFEIDQILFVIGNDVLHTDNGRTTTKGTPQDTDGAWYENYKQARELYVKCIERLLSVADVHVCHNPSNHDYVSGFMLADSVYSWFRKSKNVTFDVSNAHRKYYKYGVNMIGTTHGDGAKMEQLPLIMANEAKDIWSKTEFRYIYLHHIHHKDQVKFRSGKDYHGVTVEYLRSPSAADSWHHIHGFQHAPKGIEAFVHHKEFGQVSRISHLFK